MSNRSKTHIPTHVALYLKWTPIHEAHLTHIWEGNRSQKARKSAISGPQHILI
jgi:hypothetical protein